MEWWNYPFFNNLRKELVKMPKVFFNDTGLRNILLNRFSRLDEREDKGALLENYIFKRLAFLYNRETIMFWRTTAGHEIDFIVKEDEMKGKSYEVKCSGKNTKARNIRMFQSHYPGFDVEILSFRPEKDATWVLKL